MSTEEEAGAAEASKPAKKATAKKASVKKAPTKKPPVKKAAATKSTQPRRGTILIWTVHFPARDPDNPNQPTPSLTASVTLEDGAVVHCVKAARVIDYQSGVISRGAAVEVRYESPEEEASDNPVWVFDLIDAADPST